jgi:NadR type nicotinamide-nucleotide adenylyltransferase
LKKIVIIGPESTGKSTLCEALAIHYNTIWCREYAREYLLKNGTEYTFDNLLDVAKGQLRLEDEATAIMQKSEAQNKKLFIDTDMYVMKVWCEFVFNKCHHLIIEEIAKRNYDMYLLCNTDLPWTKDELREYPDLKIRNTLFEYYKDIVINSGVPWALVEGTGKARIQTAITAIEGIV